MKTKETLNKLKDLTNIVLERASENKQHFTECINWSKLNCYATESVVDNTGCGYYRVLIRGAYYECFMFQLFIKRELKKQGYDVEVSTAW